MDILLYTQEGNLTLVITLLSIFSCMLFLLYSNYEGWTPSFHILFFTVLGLCTAWALFSMHQVSLDNITLPPLKHFVNTFLITLFSSFYFIVSFFMYVVEEKTKIAK